MKESLNNSTIENNCQALSFNDIDNKIKSKGFNLDTISQLSFIEEICKDIVNNKINKIGEDLIKQELKRLFKVNVSSIDSIIKEIKGISNNERDVNSNNHDLDLTHEDMINAFIEKYLNNDSVGCMKQIWKYNESEGIYKSRDLNEIEAKIAKEFNKCTRCAKVPDYHNLSKFLYRRIESEDFFKDAEFGINVKNKFFKITDKNIIPINYNKDLKQRYKLDCELKETFDKIEKIKPGKLFSKYLNDCFRDDEMQIMLVQEIFGAMLCGLGHKTQQAILLFGNGNNGKSVIIEIIESIIPSYLRCAISPADISNKESYQAELDGKLFNSIGDLGNNRKDKIGAEFKDVVGCDKSFTGKKLYKDPTMFVPMASHMFSVNNFLLTYDKSKGFFRRFRFVEFKYEVNPKNKIPHFGKLIVKEELPELLSWSLIGAKRLLENNFEYTDTENHNKLMNMWKNSDNSVEVMLNDEDFIENIGEVGKVAMYNYYINYCNMNGLNYVKKNKFYDFMQSFGFETVRPNGGKEHYKNIRVKDEFGFLARI